MGLANRHLVLALLLLVHSPGAGSAQTRGPVRVNGGRLLANLESLSRIGRTPGGGNARVAFSEADREARRYVIGLMEAAGLAVSIDAAGNILARREGTNPDLPPLMLGSHIDSVPDGGHYDGQLGSLGAIEALQTLADRGITTRHPIVVVIFQNEEGGKTGSRVMSGVFRPEELDLVSHSGRTIREGIAFSGGDPERLASAQLGPGDVAGFLELHIEQGAVLEQAGTTIGVVTGIVGIRRWNVTVEGMANHAGTTPMHARRDALLAAARFIQAVNEVVRGMEGDQVGTVGMIQASPGAPNVIPGRVTMSLELRDLDMEKIERVYRAIGTRAQEIAEESATAIQLDEYYLSRSAPTDERVMQCIEEAAAGLGLSSRRMPSGAGHDAQSIAPLAPTGMIFIPSIGGISHSPDERSRPEDIIAGVDVLLNALLMLDAFQEADFSPRSSSPRGELRLPHPFRLPVCSCP
ncbi:M20 family metallo-hydrolase [Gemmatimonadota bacterium]